jgi:hypothetical protein
VASGRETNFTRSGGVDVADLVVGDAVRLDVLFLPGWVAAPWPPYGVKSP